MPNALVAARAMVRFSAVLVLTVILITLAGRMVSDFDEPADDPRDWWRGLGIWLVAGMIAALNESRLARRRKEMKQ